MSLSFFVSDLHGSASRLVKLFALIRSEVPRIVFIGGDLLPFGARVRHGTGQAESPFLRGQLSTGFESLRRELGRRYPRVVMILGNDDPRREEGVLRRGERAGLWRYLHNRRATVDGYCLYGYACIPPSPFLLKDWERYDVSRFVDVGAVPPTSGFRSVPVPEAESGYATIQQDLELLSGDEDLSRAVFLFHVPPYASALDRADLDGRMVDNAPLDVHIGSIAVRRFIERRRPYLTLHGHVHESARLTGQWREKIGATWCFSAAHDGPELAVVRFPLADPGAAERLLL